MKRVRRYCFAAWLDPRRGFECATSRLIAAAMTLSAVTGPAPHFAVADECIPVRDAESCAPTVDPPCIGGDPGCSCSSGGEGAMGPTEDACDCDGANVGPGMHVTVATGNVWTKVPVAKVQLSDGPALDFHLRYDSLFAKGWLGPDGNRPAYRNTVLGPGWTHSYNAYAIIDSQWESGGLVVVTRAGIRRGYRTQGLEGDDNSGSTYSKVVQIDWDQYRIDYPDGTKEFYQRLTAAQNITKHRLAKILDRRGRETLLTHDEGTGLLTTIRDPYGRTIALV